MKAILEEGTNMISRKKEMGVLNKEHKELRLHGTKGFPCAGYESYYTNNPEDIVPWHWHEEIEIICVEEGKLQVKIPSRVFWLKKGDCLALNSNMLHHASTEDRCKMRSLVFSSELVQGSDSSVFAEKYMGSLVSCQSFSGCHMEDVDDSQILNWFQEAFEAMEGEESGYEFVVREALSRICLFLYRRFEPQMDIGNASLNQDNLRVRKMLTYIHKNYAEDISLEEIARAADISERECFRCFKKTIQVSPIQYLLKYRIMQGAGMLLSNPLGSVSEIASACGFDSPSNFAKMFRRFYDCAPREYRSARR